MQWKVDWAMRWHILDVDYEMNGKDLIESYILSSRINKVIGGIPPVNYTYELFWMKMEKRFLNPLVTEFL